MEMNYGNFAGDLFFGKKNLERKLSGKKLPLFRYKLRGVEEPQDHILMPMPQARIRQLMRQLSRKFHAPTRARLCA